MRLKKTGMALFLCVCIVFLTGAAFNLEGAVELLEEIKIPTGTEPLIKPMTFCVTEDELFVIPDYKAGNIKVYEKNKAALELVKVIGQKGFGVNEFAEPKYCFYNKDECKFGVMDYGLRKIFIYDIINRTNFKRIHEVYCPRLGYDIQLNKDRLLVSGYENDDGKHYEFYSIDLVNNQTTFLLPSHRKFGVAMEDYESKYFINDIPAVGRKGWFDTQGNEAYFIWEGDSRVFKINVESGTIESLEGKKASRYAKPYASEGLHEGRNKGNVELIRKERNKMSYVRNIFTDSNRIIVIYEGPVKTVGENNFWLQIYTLDGKFISEASIPGQPDQRMCFDKEKSLLYSLSVKSNQEGSSYFVLKYKVL